jgi:hypothetical protein
MLSWDGDGCTLLRAALTADQVVAARGALERASTEPSEIVFDATAAGVGSF